MNTILFTGFEPFGDWQINPTQVAVKNLDGLEYSGYKILGQIIPLRYYEIEKYLHQAIEVGKPRAILMSGQAGGSQIRLERQAKNYVYTPKIPYNCGSTFEGIPIAKNSPYTYSSTLPLAKFMKSLKENDIPTVFSDDAGSFGCNQIFYIAQNKFPDIPNGFIHVPLLPEQMDSDHQESMPQEMITFALRLACMALIDWLNSQDDNKSD